MLNFFFSRHRDYAPRDLWRSYYGAVRPNKTCNNRENDCQISPDDNSFYIYASKFLNDNDGAVVIKKAGSKLLHTYCIFENYSRNDNGGAICFDCDGSIVQIRSCAINITITDIYRNGLFSFSQLKSESSNPNTISDCSVCCGSQTTTSGVLYSYYGNISLISSNISNNNINIGAGFFSVHSNNEGMINYSSFVGNNDNFYSCLNHANSNYKYECCNVINNSQSEDLYGLIYMEDQTLTIQNCTIRNNSKATFSSNDAKNGHFIVLNCNIDSIEFKSVTSSSTFNIISTDMVTLIQNPIQYDCL